MQRQDSLYEQLKSVYVEANRIGCYDAADFIMRQIEQIQSRFRCKHCKKEKGLHKADTFNCPDGLKTKIGYIRFSDTVYEED